MTKKHIIILAAGAGTRMRSDISKVLQPIAGQTMIDSVLLVAKSQKPSQITIVYGYQGDQVKAHLKDESVNWVEQAEQLGTGHAVEMALSEVDDNETVLVLYGDAPLITASDLSQLGDQQAVLTAIVNDPSGYGRIVRNDGWIKSIIEEKDATPEQKNIKEINSGIIQAHAKNLKKWIKKIDRNNAQRELYLTDVIKVAAEEKTPFLAVPVSDTDSVKGANDMVQLAELDLIMQSRYKNGLMRQGVRLKMPDSICIDGTMDCENDVSIENGVVIKGHNTCATGVHIGAYSVIKNCKLAAGTQVAAHSVLDGVTTTGACVIGPFARLRPGTVLSKGCKIGNFVETKKAIFGEYSKASHLSYLGDVEIGKDVNIGAGTITCNYDGVNKYQTVIEEGAFIGSDTQLIAPVRVGKNATIGAGSTIATDAPAEQLTLSRSPQKSILDWQRPEKEK